jgi:hypothetical protein
MTIERIDELFRNGNITVEEHSFLLRKIHPIEKSISNFAWLSLLCSGLAWILMLKYTKNGEEYQLLPGDVRLWVGVLLPTLSLVFYYLAKNEIREKEGKKGLEIAVRGQALAIAILVIVIPVFVLMIS